MKLLNSKEIQDKKKSYSEVDLYKLHKIKKSLERDILKLRKFEYNFDSKKKKAIIETDVFMKKMQEKKAKIIKEIDGLKKDRERILEPLIQERLELMELGETSKKKQLINEKIDRLDRREKKINDRELKLASEEQKLKKDKLLLENKEAILKNKQKALDNFINNNK